MVADGFTKGLGRVKHADFLRLLHMVRAKDFLSTVELFDIQFFFWEGIFTFGIYFLV